MPLDLLMVTALIVALLTIGVMVFRLRTPLKISLTVGTGRRVTVGGRSFPSDAPASEPRSFEVPLDLVSMTDDEVALSIDSSGAGSRSVSVGRQGLRTLQIDASLESGLVVYGGYDSPPKRTMAYAAAAMAKCIDCGDGIIICSFNPRCR